MAITGDISSIKLPNNNEYSLKDKTQTRSDHRHYETDLVPLVSKVYESTSYYATTTDFEGSSWYFMSVRPDDWYKPWSVKLKFYSYCPNYTAYKSFTDSTISGRTGGIIYANWNETTSTTAHCYVTVYPLKKVGYDSGFGHAIAISIYGASDYNKSDYYRTFEVDFLECENCTVTILDTPVKWSNWTGTGTTNYESLQSLNATTRGLQESGDANTVTENRIGYFAGKTGTKGIWAGSFFMETSSSTFENICTASDGTVTSSNRTTATTKIANTTGFRVGSPIWYSNTSYNANTNIAGASVVYSSISAIESRYGFNTTLTTNSLTPYVLVYLVGTIHSDGLFYLDTVWWTQTPNDRSKIYILFGGVYDSTTSNCRVTLYEQNKWYRYDGTKLIELVDESTDVNCLGYASGTIAHFEDGADDVPMKSVVANIVPVQDLHGYSKPWAAGAGKNKFDKEDENLQISGYISASKIVADVNSLTVFTKCKPNTTYTVSKTAGNRFIVCWHDQIPNVGDTLSGQIIDQQASAITITTGATASYIVAFVFNASVDTSITRTQMLDSIQIEEGSTATAYEPYANVCPISGTDELTLNHKGKNLFDPSTEFSTLYVYGVAKNLYPSVLLRLSFTDNDTTQDISGVYFGFVSSNYTGGAPTVYRWAISNGRAFQQISNFISDEYMTGLFYFPNNPTTLEKVLNRFNVQIEVGSTATTFEPYNAETYTFDLGQTIYGGGADCISGTGSITWGIIDLSTINWSITTNRALTAVLRDIIKPPLNNSVPTEAIAEKYDSVAWSESLDNHKTSYAVASDGTLVFYYDGATPTGLFAYPLATPTEYTFTGQPINSYLGVNNVWTDSGEVLDVEYYKNTNIIKTIIALNTKVSISVSNTTLNIITQ